MNPDGKTDEQVSAEGLNAMEEYMNQLGLVMKISELGVTEDMIADIAKSSFILPGGYRVLTTEEIQEILKNCM